MISAVTVNYRTESYLQGLLGMLDRERLIGEIILVDNSPEPLPFDPEEISGKKVIHISNRENVGLAKAVNQAAKIAAFPDLLLINPDVRPLEGSIPRLYETAKNWSAAVAGPRFYWDDGKIFRLPPADGASLFWQCALAAAQADPVDERLVAFYWQIRFERFWQALEPFVEPFLGGACLLVNIPLLDRKDLFDERFFLYYEETDLCHETIKKGLKALCIPQAEMIHHWSMSPPPARSKSDLRTSSAKVFMDKHYPGIPIPSFPKSIASVGKKARPECKMKEMRDIQPPIRFQVPDVPDRALYFEIGANPLLIPFAQAQITARETFILPEEIWSRMEPREYFMRFRGELSGTIETWNLHKKK